MKLWPLILVAGCGLPLLERSYPAPTKEVLLEAAQAHRRSVKSLRATAKVDQRTPTGRIKVKVELAFAASGKLRAEILSPLGGSAATLASDGESFVFFDRQHSRFLSGPACAENIVRFLQLAFTPQELSALLAGSAPMVGGPSSSRWERRGGREVLELSAPDGSRETLVFDGKPTDRDLLWAERKTADGSLVWRVEHRQFESGLPAITDVVQGKTKVSIRFRSREPNLDLPDELFRLQRPPGVLVETVDCGR